MHLQRTLLNKKSKLQRTQIFCCHFDKVQKEAKFSKLDSLKIILHIIVKEYRTVSDKVNLHRAVHCGGGKGTKIVKLRVHEHFVAGDNVLCEEIRQHVCGTC